MPKRQRLGLSKTQRELDDALDRWDQAGEQPEILLPNKSSVRKGQRGAWKNKKSAEAGADGKKSGRK